jgi:beta-glucanase (GH16 family)
MYLDGQSHLVVKNTGRVDNYTESKLVSQDKVTLGYGTFSASIKMPPGRGLWPAFWLLGGNNDTVPWPSCGEIGVIELISDPTAGFHTYLCTHLDDAITFGIDSTTFGTMTPSTGPQDVAWPCNQPFYIILDLATGDGRWCPKPNATTPFPAIMLVDWVKWEPAS